MNAIEKISRSELRLIHQSTNGLPAGPDQDEMAIPSYLHWNPLIRWVVWRRHELLADLGRFKGDEEVLDFGCGTGVLLPTLCLHGSRVHAIDFFPNMAKRLCEHRNLQVLFHDNLDAIPDASLDVIIAAEVLEHVDDGLSDLLIQFSRKIKAGGRLLVSLPVEGLVYKVGRWLAGFGDKGEYHHSTAAQVIEIIKQNGFSEVHRKGIPLDGLAFLYLVVEFECPPVR